MTAYEASILLALFALAPSCEPPTKSAGPAGAGSVATSAPATATPGTSPPTAPASAGANPSRRLVMVEAAADADALSLVRTKRLEAKAEGRVLVVYVGATWCEPCKRFKAEAQSGRLDARLGKTTLLVFDADRDVDRLGAAGYTFGFVPLVALPGPDGRPLESQQATSKGGDAWRELLDKLGAWQSGL